MISNITCWLDETVRRFPDKIAYVDESRQFTWKEMQEKALEIATVIIEMGFIKVPVAVYMEKSVDTLTAFFAVAYSGNFYSPIDIKMPVARASKIIEILQPKVIITRKSFLPEISQYGNNVCYICIEEVESGKKAKEKVLAQRDKTCDTDLLYVLFTSGSTGIPKGVTISHRSVMDYIDCVEDIFKMNEHDIYGNQAPFYFDNSILDIYTTMKTGATMYIIPEELFPWPIRLLEYIKERKISVIFWVPSALILTAKLKALIKVDMKGCLKKILFCGEVMPNKWLNIWRDYLPDAIFANLYGPTEITDACTYYIVDRDFADEEPLPIGIAMKNTEIMVFNEKNELVKSDEVGELCVRGTSLSHGYYHNEAKTREVFVQNPLNDAYPEIIYRTGDLVKYNEKNELIYLARKDFQIKHLGHRIELGEIETAVSSLEEIAFNCCLYDEKKNKIVLFIEQELDIFYIKDKLKSLLPEYMLPNRVICLKSMPINANGKIDRTALKELL